MDAARNGSAKKMRRSTPIFQTVRQASPSEGGASTGMSRVGAAGLSSSVMAAAATSPSATGSPRSEASICSLNSICSCRPRAGSRIRVPMRTTTTMGTAKTKNGVRHDHRAERPAPMSTPAMAPMLMPERCAE